MKKLLILCFTLLISSQVECSSDYKYSFNANGWFKTYKVFANWNEASSQCFRDHAVLASPISTDILNEMLQIIRAPVNQKQSYFIGAHSNFSPGNFVAIEGVPLDNMPVADMIRQLNLNNGECLSTDGYEIKVTSCAELMPYICYKEQVPNMEITACGTYDEEYKLEQSTGSCYKLHKEYRTWEEANSMCISEGGYLVIVNDDNEASLIYSMFPKTELHTSHSWRREWDPLFIGLRNWGGNGWRSIHGKPLEQLYHDWQDGEPSGHIEGQFCGAIVRQGRLDNVDCNLPGFYVCEKDPKNIRFKKINEGLLYNVRKSIYGGYSEVHQNGNIQAHF